MLIFIWLFFASGLCLVNSNTSNVNLYLLYPGRGQDLVRHSNTSNVNLYLGLRHLNKCQIRIQIHPMLIFIFVHVNPVRDLPHSNTSNVNLYLWCGNYPQGVKIIQIHPMLIFIKNGSTYMTYLFGFKYIQC